MDVIVTGLPRSGSTLAAALIDYLPDSVCLNAPPWQLEQARKLTDRPKPFGKWLLGDFASVRAQLLDKKPIYDFRAEDGSPLLDGIHDARAPKSPVLFTRPGLTRNFTLGMKHHALYTAILPTLAEFKHFTIIAVIRHPLDVISSWKRLGKHAIAQGKLPAAARFWPEASRISSSKGNVLDRMVQLYDAHIERYHELRGKIHIVKYEDIIDDPMLVSRLLGHAELPANASMIEHRPRVLMSDESDAIRNCFRKYGVFTRHYYQKI